MIVERSRIVFLAGAASLVLAGGAGAAARAGSLPGVTVYKTPN
jgi:hypothetical protein